MPIRVEVEGIGQMEFPDGTDPAVIQATVKRVAQQPSGEVSGDPQERMRQLNSNWSKNNPLKAIGNVARGGVDVIGGGAQLLARGANAIGLVPESNPGGLIAGPKDVEAQNAQARKNIDESYFGKSEGFSPVRAASAGVLTMPLAPLKFLQAPTGIGRAVGAGLSGGVTSALQEVESPKDSGDFWARKGIQTAMGVGGSALAQPIAEQAVKYIIGGLNTVADKAIAGTRNLTGANSMDKVVSLAREALKKSGIDFDSLNESAKQGLLDDVQKALGSYSGVNLGAVARQAAFRQEGFDPLRHWVTRDPSEFTTLENLSHTEVGNPLKQRKADLDKLAQDRLLSMRGDQPNPAEVGKRAQGDLKGFLGQEEGKTNVLYNTFREIAPNAKGEPQRFVSDLFGGLEGEMALASLPSGVQNIINKISKGEIPLTPSTLYQLQKMGNKMYGADGSTNYALGHLSRAIDKELEAISGAVAGEGLQAADVLKMARGQAAKTFGAKEESKMLRAVESGAPPENFLDNLNKTDLKDLAATWMRMGNEAKAGVRAQTIDELKRLTFGGASDDAGKPASQAMLNNYLSEPKNASRLKIILGDRGLEDVKRLALMLESAHMQPSGSAVNNSKTGGALVNSLDLIASGMKAKGIPGGSWAADSSARGLAQAAQAVPPEALGSRSLVIDPAVEEILKRRFGQGAGLLAASAYPQLQGLLGK